MPASQNGSAFISAGERSGKSVVASGEPLAHAVRDALARGRETLCRARFSSGAEAVQSSHHLLVVSGHGTSLDAEALELASGRVLDVGAGAGRHTLVLQERGVEVCALESAPTFCELMRGRGVRDVLEADVTTLREGRWDTLLMLHGSIGMARTLARLPDPDARERQVQLTYRHWVGEPFAWVWPTVESAARSASRAGLSFDVVAEEHPGFVLARLQRR